MTRDINREHLKHEGAHAAEAETSIEGPREQVTMNLLTCAPRPPPLPQKKNKLYSKIVL